MEDALTLRDVCAQLGVSRKTLSKWMMRLDVTAERHKADYRYFLLTRAQVETIKDARASMPDARDIAPARVRTRFSASVATERMTSAQNTDARLDSSLSASHDLQRLPADLASMESFALSHGIARQTVMKAIHAGRLICAPGGPWRSDRAWVVYALDQQGRERFRTLWSHLPTWRD